MNSLAEIWSSVLDVLRSQLSSTAMTTWFSDCEPIDINFSENTMVLKTSTTFKRQIIEDRFSTEICNTLNDLFACTDFKVKLLLADEIDEYMMEKKGSSTMPEMDGYTFDNFIVGKSNQFAHAAALAVAKEPGKNYNPLMIYGNSGLGKTHLLLAIGQYIEENSPKKPDIKYLKGDEFTVQMVESIKSGKSEEFRQKYRNVVRLS